MNYRVIILFFFVAQLFFTGCNKETIDTYSHVDNIYFWNDKYRLPTENYTQRDSIIHSFIEVPDGIVRDTVWVLMQASGYLSSEDRPITLRQVRASDGTAAAEPDVHYVPFDQIRYVMPANEMLIHIPVVLLRDESLLTTEYRLEFEVTANEFFQPGIPEYSRFIVYTSDMLSKPARWDQLWRMGFGEWSRVKMRFLIDHVTGNIEWDSPDYGYSAMYGYRPRAYQKWQEEYVLQGKELRDENNNLIEFSL